jgi:isoleucyl-tRNA synthetase
MAPVLSFTAEEIWGYLSKNSDENDSVFLHEFMETQDSFNQPELALEFDRLVNIRTLVNKALEEARGQKLIGAPLEADVFLKVPSEDLELLNKYNSFLPELFIVSTVSLEESQEFSVKIQASSAPKCPRCWTRHPQVPADLSGVCPKCQKALS